MVRPLHILVTGASGFVGQALVRMALARGHAVTALVREGSAGPQGASLLHHGLGSGLGLTLPAGVDAVAHLAQSRVYRSFPADAEEMFRVNVAGAHEVLRAAAAANVSRFCLVSSGTVYEPFCGSLNEDAPLAPTTNLGATKLAAEMIARPYGAVFPVSILRLFGPYGPGQTARLVPDLIRRVREGAPVILPETGGGMVFTPTYVDDVCETILEAVTQSWSGAFNVASSEALSIEEAVRVIGRALGKAPLFERKPGHAPVLAPDMTKLGLRHDLTRFRSFAAGVEAILAAEG